MVFKIIQVVFLASFKYIITIPYALIIGLNFNQTMVYAILGGVAGFLFFYYLSGGVMKRSNRIKSFVSLLIPQKIKARYSIYRRNRKGIKAKVFTRKSRFIVKLRRSYGLWGIVITTPVLLSIPVGAFLANKYYSRRKNVVLYMVLSIVGWGAALSAFVHIFPAIVK
jgi:hypothetical protein